MAKHRSRSKTSKPGRRALPGAIQAILIAAVLAVALGAGWYLASPPEEAAAEEEVARLALEVVAVHPHDPGAFTQGLLWHDAALWEGTGRYGRSEVRRVKLETGEVLARAALPPGHFGEGLARVGERLVQLTWHEEVALVWDMASLEQVGEHRYSGEGWGLCHDGRRLVMSDGSDQLVFRDPESFAETGRVRVTLEGRPLGNLNELECVGGEIYANVWGTEDIARIDPESGRVAAVIDASGLLTREERLRTDVLNGIAHRPETGTFLLTGKLWPKLFEVVWKDPSE